MFKVKPKKVNIEKGGCEICGNKGLVYSTVNIAFNYGSVNDGEKLCLDVCGNCVDEIYSAIQRITEGE